MFWRFISMSGLTHTGFLHTDLKNPNDSTVHSPFTKRQAFTPSSTMMEVFLQEKPPAVVTSTAAPPPPSSPLPSKPTSAPQMSPGSSDNQSSSPQPAQQKLKQQKKKASLTSKVAELCDGCHLRAGRVWDWGIEVVRGECRLEAEVCCCSSHGRLY